MYTSIDQVTKAFFDLMDQCPFEENDPHKRKMWFDAHEEGQLLKTLWEIYFEAHHNAPEGVIGVGKITYAEQAMIAYQEGLVK